MKLAHIITSIAFSSALMGCQIEMTPLEEDTISGSVTVTESSTTTVETTTADATTTENTGTVTETTNTTASQDNNISSDSTADETATNTVATDEATTTDSSVTDSSVTDNTDTTTAMNAATLYWSAPLVRANDATLSFSEIGGYEIRYKLPADVEYNSVIINDASVEQYSFDTLDNAEAYRFEVAAFDVNGIYSEFVAAN